MEQSEIVNLTVGDLDMALLVGWDSEEVILTQPGRCSYREVQRKSVDQSGEGLS